MEKGKNKVLWSFITVAIAVVSIWAVTKQARDFSLDNFIDYLKGTNPWYLILAFSLMFCFIFFEGFAILRIVKAFGYPRGIKKGFLYSCSDIYFSAITPSASGGQPACAYFMMKDGIPAGIVTAALILNLIMYTASIMVLGILAIIIKPSIFFNFSNVSKTFIVLGYIILSGVMVGFIMTLRHGSIIRKICAFFLKLFKKMHLIKNLDAKLEKLDKAMNDYASCSKLIAGQKKMLVEVFLYNFIQRTAQITVPAIIYLSIGGSGTYAFKVWVTQVMVTMGSNYVPIPGAMGIVDYLLLDGLGDMMTIDAATNLDLLSRGVSFYCCVLFSLIVVAIGYVIYNKKEDKDIG